ncbi:MAG: DUF2889 domain-containing protein [Myxococcota bacterium]
MIGREGYTLDPDRTFRRQIRLRADGANVTGELADDAHHFRVTLEHDGAKVVSLDGNALRHPWSTCPEALSPLRELVGMPLSERATAVGAYSAARRNCTHWFDLAGLAVAHAASGRTARDYTCAVWGHPQDEVHATLARDGERLFAWRLVDDTIHGDPPFDGRSLRGGFLAWAEETLPLDLAEAAIVLRRGCTIGGVRFLDLDHASHAPDVQIVAGQCHTYTKGTAERAKRMHGSRRDFTRVPGGPLGPTDEEPSAPA